MIEQAELDMGQEEPEGTTRDALESAFDEHNEPVVIEGEVTEVSQTPPVIEAPKLDPETGLAAEEAPGDPGELKAPQSWSPAAREEWGNTPPAVQETIAKREQEMQTVMQESAQARQFGQHFEQSMAPFQQIFAGQGVDPMAGISEVMQTAAPLYAGTPQQKAETVAQLIQQFGVDVSTLDDLLVGRQQPPQSPEMQSMQQQMDQMSQYIQNQQFGQQQQQFAQQNQVNGEVEQFITDNEFAGDLRGVMADFMSMANNQGQQLSLPDAYQRAISTRPDIQQIIANREQGHHNEQVLGNARQAAQSIPQNSGFDNSAPPPQSTREAIEQAWDQS